MSDFMSRVYAGRSELSIPDWKNSVARDGGFIVDASALRKEIFEKAGVAYSEEDRAQQQPSHQQQPHH